MMTKEKLKTEIVDAITVKGEICVTDIAGTTPAGAAHSASLSPAIPMHFCLWMSAT